MLGDNGGPSSANAEKGNKICTVRPKPCILGMQRGGCECVMLGSDPDPGLTLTWAGRGGKWLYGRIEGFTWDCDRVTVSNVSWPPLFRQKSEGGGVRKAQKHSPWAGWV